MDPTGDGGVTPTVGGAIDTHAPLPFSDRPSTSSTSGLRRGSDESPAARPYVPICSGRSSLSADEIDALLTKATAVPDAPQVALSVALAALTREGACCSWIRS